MHTDVTCADCLKRQASVDGLTFRERWRVGPPARLARALAQGHAMYRVTSGRSQGYVSLCVAPPRKERG